MAAKATELLLEPVIQKHASSDMMHVLEKDGLYYVNIEEMADHLQMQYAFSKNRLTMTFLEKTSEVNLRNHPSSAPEEWFLPLSFYEKYLPIKMSVQPLDAQLIIDSDQLLPTTQQYNRNQARSNMIPLPGLDSYSNYAFDDRWFASPVIDFSYQKNFRVSDYHQTAQKSFNSDTYQIDAGFLFANLDTALSVFGNSEMDNYAPRARLTMGRTFLEEPKNPVNLTTFEMGDVQSFNNTIFTNGNHGRGVALSSFKDLVLSADKTIDITGPLADGWEVELYLNNQLIGFRRQGSNGRYEFKNIPVNYGLNAFRVMFYGPYGEIRSEDKHYYSGTSPVKSGEFGYTANVYQKNRYLFEDNEPLASDSNHVTSELTGYYGLTDYVTLMAGFSNLQQELTDQDQSFAHTGLQVIFAGASFQYNLMSNLTEEKIGHHVEVQGDVYVGNIFARYDHFGDLNTPTSFYGNRYLKDQFEGRLTGSIPGALPLPYYVSYQKSRDDSGWEAQEISVRLSPNFMQYYNFSIENNYYKDNDLERDALVFLLQAQYGLFGAYAQSRYQIQPDSYLQNVGIKLDYRWDRNTFMQGEWTHEYSAPSMHQEDVDLFTLGASRLFFFGGLQASLSADLNNNYAAHLTYNLSFGKTPNRNGFFTDARTTMTDNAAIYIRAVDESGQPMPHVTFNITSWQDPFVTDEDGTVLISDLQPYQKTILSIDLDSVEDVSMVPDFTEKKFVLRPGTLLPVDVTFTHKGDLEGVVVNGNRPYLYKVILLDKNGEQIASKTPSRDGSFIIGHIPFGAYTLIVQNKFGDIKHQQSIIIDRAFTGLEQAIQIK